MTSVGTIEDFMPVTGAGVGCTGAIDTTCACGSPSGETAANGISSVVSLGQFPYQQNMGAERKPRH